MERNWTTVNISLKHDRLLDRIVSKTRRDKKAEIELMIEREALNLAVN